MFISSVFYDCMSMKLLYIQMLRLPYIGSPESVHVFTYVSGLIWFTVMCLLVHKWLYPKYAHTYST